MQVVAQSGAVNNILRPLPQQAARSGGCYICNRIGGRFGFEAPDLSFENLEVWCTETGSHAFSWRKPEKFLTYDYSIELARIYSRVLKLTGTTAILYWEMMGHDYWINDGTEPYPSFHVIRQLGEQIPPGSLIVETSNNTEDFYSVADFERAMSYFGDMAIEVAGQQDRP